MNKPLVFGLITGICLSVSALLLLAHFGSKKVDGATDEFSNFSEIVSGEARLKELYSPNREAYGVGKYLYKGKVAGFEITSAFSSLSELPTDFWKVKYEFMNGLLPETGYASLSEQYYEQPEFYGNTFFESQVAKDGLCLKGTMTSEGVCATGCINQFVNPDVTHRYLEGYGVFPLGKGVRIKAGENITIYTFFQSGCGVQTYQGIGLEVEWPTWTKSQNGTIVQVSAADSQKYFAISVTPEQFYLTPSYPKYLPGWARKVGVTIKAANDLPSGVYAVGLNVVDPSNANSAYWSQLFGSDYSGKSFFSVQPVNYPNLFNVYIEGVGE